MNAFDHISDSENEEMDENLYLKRLMLGQNSPLQNSSVNLGINDSSPLIGLLKVPGAPPAVGIVRHHMASFFHRVRTAESSIQKEQLNNDVDGDGQALLPVVRKRASKRVKTGQENQVSSRQASSGSRESVESPTTPSQTQCTGPFPPAPGSSQTDPLTRCSRRKRVAADSAVDHRVAPNTNIPPDQENSQHNKAYVGEASQAPDSHLSERQQTSTVRRSSRGRERKSITAYSNNSEPKTLTQSEKVTNPLLAKGEKADEGPPSARHKVSKRAPSSQAEREPRLESKKKKTLMLNQINRRNRFGETKLHLAVLSGNEQDVRDMVKLGASINAPDYAGWTPLHEAVLTKHMSIMKHLLRGGALVNAAANNGVTPLHDAVKLGEPQMICVLMKHGADPLLRDVMGVAPIDLVTTTAIAKQLGFPDMKICSQGDVKSSGNCPPQTSYVERNETATFQGSSAEDSYSNHCQADQTVLSVCGLPDGEKRKKITDSRKQNSPLNFSQSVAIRSDKSQSGNIVVSDSLVTSEKTELLLTEENGERCYECLDHIVTLHRPKHKNLGEAENGQGDDNEFLSNAGVMHPHSSIREEQIEKVSKKLISDLCTKTDTKTYHNSEQNKLVCGRVMNHHNDTRDLSRSEDIGEVYEGLSFRACQLKLANDEEVSERVDMKMHLACRSNYLDFTGAVANEYVVDNTECSVSLLACHKDTCGSRKRVQNEEMQTVSWCPEPGPALWNASSEAHSEPTDITPSLQISHTGLPHLDETHTGETVQNSHTYEDCASDGSETQRDTSRAALNRPENVCISPPQSVRRDEKCDTQMSQLNGSSAKCFLIGAGKSEPDQGLCRQAGPIAPMNTSCLPMDSSDATMLSHFELIPNPVNQEIASENMPGWNFCDVQCEKPSGLQGSDTSMRENLGSSVFSEAERGVSISNQVQSETEMHNLNSSSDSDCTMISESEDLLANKSRPDVTEIEPTNPNFCPGPCSQNEISNGNDNLHPNGSESETFSGLVTWSNADTAPTTSVPRQGLQKHKAKAPKQRKRQSVSGKSQDCWKPWQLGKTFERLTDSPVDKAVPMGNAMVNMKTIHKRNGLGETQLHRASKKGDLALVKALLEAGTDVNMADYAGWTPLHEASAGGFAAVVEELLCAGADVTSRGPEGLTPLHDAVVSGWMEVVKLLLQYGANPNDRNAQGKNALDVARHEDIKEVLSTFKGTPVQCVRPRHPVLEHTEQAKPSIQHQVSRQSKPVSDPKNNEPNRITFMNSNVCLNVADHADSIMAILDEVERKQKDMSACQDKEKFMEEWSQMQTKLNEVLMKQQSAKDNLTNKYRMAPDSFEQGTLRESLKSLASRQKRLLGLLQRQSELKLKVHAPKGRPDLGRQEVSTTASKQTNPISFETGIPNNHVVMKDPIINKGVSTSFGQTSTKMKRQQKETDCTCQKSTSLSGTGFSSTSTNCLAAPIYTLSLPTDLAQGKSGIVLVSHGGQSFAFADLSTLTVPAAPSKQHDPKVKCSTPPHSTDSSQTSLTDLEVPENPLTMAQGILGTSHQRTGMSKARGGICGTGGVSVMSRNKRRGLKSSTGSQDAAGGAKGRSLNTVRTEDVSRDIQQDNASETQGSGALQMNAVRLEQNNQLASLIRQGLRTPEENALEFKVKGSCHHASLLNDGSIRDINGRHFSTPEQWAESVLGNNISVSSTYAWEKITFRSKPLSTYLVSADNTKGSQAAGVNASEPLASLKGVKNNMKGNFMGIKSIQLICNDEFAPTHIIDQYWEVITKLEDWRF